MEQVFVAKMPGNIILSPANKENLISNLQSILKYPDFCGQESPDTERLGLLLTGFDDKVRFVIEFPYVDRHYRDTYYSFHSSKLKKVGRDCIRVHLFDGEVTKDDLLKKENGLDEKYWGFFIIRPLLHSILGRSLISPKAFKKNEYVCCLMKIRVSLLGNELTVYGFPHITQDRETHTCAESALWSYIEYFGSKYPQYKPLLPSQIIKTLLDTTEHRLLPSKGLTKDELAKCLQNNGFQCQIYSFSNSATEADKNAVHFRVIQIYIESGIPLLLILGGNGHGHTVLAIGHQEDDSIYDSQNHHFPDGLSWADVSYFNKKLILIDDNKPPYQIADVHKPADYYPNTELKKMRIKSFITPLPEHMFLAAEKVYAMAEKIFNTKIVGLQTNGEKWITRLFLTVSRSFKEFLFKTDNTLAPVLKNRLLSLPLPKYSWVCQIFKAHEYTKNGLCSGLLIIDPTSDGILPASVLFYAIDNNMFSHDNVIWDKKPARIVPFRMETYRNNLKGEWSKWKS
jgi:hypothetical protein